MKMKSLITPQKVVELAFGDGEYVADSAVSVADIASAEFCHIRPIVGKELYERLLDNAYPELVEEYVAPAIAMAVRTMIQPALNVRTGQTGLVMPSTAHASTASTAASEALLCSLRQRRQRLLARLACHLKENAERYPEYDAANDITNKCRIDGGFIQIR